MEMIGRFSLEQKIFFNLVFVLLIVSGFFAMFALPVERYPDINMAVVKVTTDYPSASPIDVESLVTRKLEEAIENIENIEWISSTSQAERSYIRIKLIDDSDYDQLYDEIRFNILNAKEELPEQVDQPEIEAITMGGLLPVMIVNLGGDHENRALTLIAEQVKASLKQIQGLKKVIVSGDLTREFHVYLDPDKLRLLGISFEEVVTALQQANVSMTAGSMDTFSEEFLIKVDEKFNSRNKLVKTIIRRDGDGRFIRLNDLITRADFNYRKPSVISSVNGKNSIALNIIKMPEGNALAIKADIVKVLDSFKPLFELENLEITLTQDSSIKINDGLSTLGWNFVVGMILVSLGSWYFMGIRNAGLITIGIPFSFLFTMLIMYLTSYSFNEITLFAFVLVSGIIVDDAIVVTENIYRYIQKGYQINQAITEGVAEVALPVFSSTLTTMAAFLPMLIMTGTTGEFFAQIPVVVCFALFASLFECFFILPVHYLDFGPQKAQLLAQRLENDNFLVSFFRAITQRVLKWTLRFRVLTIMSVLVLLGLSVGIMYVSMTGILPLVKTQFFPDDYAIYFVDVKGPPNTSIKEIDRINRSISTFIMADGPGKAKSAAGKAGLYMNEDYELIHGNNVGVVLVTLPAKNEQTIGDPLLHLDNMRQKLKKQFEHDGFVVSVHPMKEGPPSGKAINVKVMGNDLNSVSQLAANLFKFLQTESDISSNLVELENDRGAVKRVYRFDIRHDRVKEYNLSSQEVALLASSVLDGRYIGQFRSKDEEIDLKLLVDQESITSPKQTLSIPVVENTIRPILLGDLTKLGLYDETSEFHRYQGVRTISIKADMKTGAQVSSAYIINKIGDYYDSIRGRYPGASIIFSGEHENTQRSYESLIFAFCIAVMIIYMVLAVQFQSYLQPLIILFAILFAIIGIVLGKFLTQSIFTINSFIAVVGVIGVVVNDSLVLIDFMNKGYRSGMTRQESIDNAIKIRLRPIILTTLTTILGLLPMALGIPSYSIVWGAMASTFVCGLGVATLLTLWVAPVLWDLIQERQEKV